MVVSTVVMNAVYCEGVNISRPPDDRLNDDGEVAYPWVGASGDAGVLCDLHPEDGAGARAVGRHGDGTARVFTAVVDGLSVRGRAERVRAGTALEEKRAREH